MDVNLCQHTSHLRVEVTYIGLPLSRKSCQGHAVAPIEDRKDFTVKARLASVHKNRSLVQGLYCANIEGGSNINGAWSLSQRLILYSFCFILSLGWSASTELHQVDSEF